MDKTEILTEIRAVFDSLQINMPPESFLIRCLLADCKFGVALNALKEFAVAQQVVGAELVSRWNELVARCQEKEKTLRNLSRADREEAIIAHCFAEIKRAVLMDESALKLIKVKLW